MPQEKVSGLAIVVVDDKSILWAEGFGYTDWDRRIPVTQRTLFSIQSMSKSFTATAAMFAAQDGLVDLDAPITDYLPDFHVNSIFEEHPEQKITLRMLLSHTAGFSHEAPYGGNFDLQDYSFERHIASISDTWLMFPVGTHFSYSNLGVDLAGYILQVRAGMPFTQYVQEKVPKPLGMTNSTLDIRQVRATSERAIGHNLLPLRPPVESLIIPSGGVWTTAEDMNRYLQFHINEGSLDGRSLLREDLAETMYTPPNFPAQKAYQDGGYALGITVGIRNGARHFQHGGGGFGFNSSMAWYPELKLGVVVLTTAEITDWYYQLSEDVLDSIIESNPALYSKRAGKTARVEPTYLPSQKVTFLSDKQLKSLIVSKALPVDEASLKRWKAYTGMYVLTKWGIPIVNGEASENNGILNITFLEETSPLIEVQPGLFFTPSGDAFDVREKLPTFMNVRMFRANPQSFPIRIAFNATCGLLFLSAFLLWPARPVIHGIRRKGHRVDSATVRPPRNPWMDWAVGLVAIASLFSLLCLAIVAIVPNLVYVPWPRPYADLLWSQSVLLSLPVAALLLAVGIALLVGFAMRNRALGRATNFYFLMVALALFAFNLAAII